MVVGSDHELFHLVNNRVSHNFVISNLKIRVEMQKLQVVIKEVIENNDCVDPIVTFIVKYRMVSIFQARSSISTTMQTI